MLKEYLKASKTWVEDYLKEVLNSPNTEYEKLYESMRYSLLMGGKRIRPILTKRLWNPSVFHRNRIRKLCVPSN